MVLQTPENAARVEVELTFDRLELQRIESNLMQATLEAKPDIQRIMGLDTKRKVLKARIDEVQKQFALHHRCRNLAADRICYERERDCPHYNSDQRVENTPCLRLLKDRKQKPRSEPESGEPQYAGRQGSCGKHPFQIFAVLRSNRAKQHDRI